MATTFDFIPSSLHSSIINGTNTVDLQPYLDVAFAQAGEFITMLRGTYLTSNLAKPSCSGIIGHGDNSSILKATTTATKILPVGSACKVLKHFRIEGNGQSNAIGLHIGDAPGDAGAFDVECVRVRNFNGAGAVGIKVDYALKSVFNLVTVEGSTKNVWIEGNNSFPTTLTFNSLTSASGPGIALEITGGDRLTFNDFIADSSTAESVIVRPNAGWVASNIVFNRPRFENDTDAVVYDTVFDASAANSKVGVVLRDAEFAYSNRRSMRFLGSGCSFYLDNPQVPSAADMIVIDSLAVGTCPAWPSNLLPVYNIVTDNVRTAWPGLGLQCPDAAWIAYTPTYSSDIGNAAATFTGTPTTGLARYRQVGKTMQIQVQWDATLKAVTPTAIFISMPGSLTAPNVQSFGPCLAKNNGTWEAGSIRGMTTGTLAQGRTQWGAGYTSGGQVGGFITHTVELA